MGLVLSLLEALRPHLSLKALRRGWTTPQGNRLPHAIHKRALFYPTQTGRLIVIGDVHGCAVELAELLVKLKYDQGRDQLVFVGDLVNKGPKSLQVIQIAMKTGAHVVRGNHDDKALAVYEKLQYLGKHETTASKQWVEDMTSEQASFLRELPFTVSFPSHRLLVVHAGFVPNRPIARQDLLEMYTMRHVAAQSTGLAVEQNKVQYETCGTSQGEPWASKWEGSEHVIFGHDAKRKLQQHQHATGLDTGCVYGGSLTACVMPISSISKLDPDTAPTLGDLGAELIAVQAREQYVVPSD